VSGHMFQHVGCRLNRSLAHLVHANFVSAVLADHRGIARNVSSRFVHGEGWAASHDLTESGTLLFSSPEPA
jgi:hypothetical protein